MLVANCLFRVGGAAMLLTSKKPKIARPIASSVETQEENNAAAPPQQPARPFHLRLLHVERVHLGSDPVAFGSVIQEEDSERCKGVRLSKELDLVAARAMKLNLTRIAPQCLSWAELIRAGWAIWRGDKSFIPDFRSGIAHFCIHAGGSKLLRVIGDKLKLDETLLAPSKRTLEKYGNVSSSSVWYEMNEIRHQDNWRSGEKILQIAFGAGFKCNSAVWAII